jgi:hypothetical protein
MIYLHLQIFFATFFPYYAVSDPAYPVSVKAATCLLAPSCFALGANVFADFEGGLVGVQVEDYILLCILKIYKCNFSHFKIKLIIR